MITTGAWLSSAPAAASRWTPSGSLSRRGRYPDAKTSTKIASVLRAVADEVDMRVDHPGQHGRIAVVDQLTIGGRLVSHRFHPDNAALLHEYSAATGAEIFTVEVTGCTDREHTAWLPNPLAPVNAFM